MNKIKEGNQLFQVPCRQNILPGYNYLHIFLMHLMCTQHNYNNVKFGFVGGGGAYDTGASYPPPPRDPQLTIVSQDDAEVLFHINKGGAQSVKE